MCSSYLAKMYCCAVKRNGYKYIIQKIKAINSGIKKNLMDIIKKEK